MALVLLRRTCTLAGSGRFDFERFAWNTVTKEIDFLDGVMARCAFYSAPTLADPVPLLVDGPYVIPSSGPGYEAGHVGETVRIYHDGMGDVTRIYGACNLLLSVVITSGASSSSASDGVAEVEYGTTHGPVSFRYEGPGLPSGGLVTGSAVLTGLGIGDYTVTLTDANGCTVSGDFTIDVAPVYGCRNPLALNYNPMATAGSDESYCTFAPPAPRAPHFVLPPINPLHLLEVTGAEPDGITVFSPLLKTAYCADVPSSLFARPPFLLPVQIGDVHTIQWQSNYATHSVEVINARTGSLVQSHTVNVRDDRTAATDDFPVWLMAHPADTTKLRVYFHAPRLPQPFEVGQAVTLTTPNPAMDGPALISAVQTDPTAGGLYLVVSRPWAGGAVRRLDATLTSDLAAQDYQVLESTIDFNTVPAGEYLVRLTADDEELGNVLVESEPLHVAARHEHTMVVEWRNYDNAFGILYDTGISHRMRVRSTLFQTKPGGARTVARDSNHRLRKAGGSVWLVGVWQIEKVPRWVIEQLAAALEHDLVLLDRQEIISESGFPEPEYVNRYTLVGARVDVELVGAFTRGNGDDIGGPLPGAGDTGIAGISSGDGLIAYEPA